MTLQTRLSDLITAIGADVKKMGVLTSLTTTAKTSLVAAINELKSVQDVRGTGGGSGLLANRPATSIESFRYFARDVGETGLDMIFTNGAWESTMELILLVGAPVPVGIPNDTTVRRITSPFWASTDFAGGSIGAAVTPTLEPIFNAFSGTMTYQSGLAGVQSAQVAGVNGNLALSLGGRTDARFGFYISTAGGGTVPTATHYLMTFRAGTTNVCDVVVRSAANVRRISARQNFTYPTTGTTQAGETIDDGEWWWVEAHLSGTSFTLEIWTEDNLTSGAAPDYTIGPLTTTVGTVDNMQIGNSAVTGLTVKHAKFRAGGADRMGPQ